MDLMAEDVMAAAETRRQWLLMPITVEEVLERFLRLHLLLGPVELEFDNEFRVTGGAVKWIGETEESVFFGIPITEVIGCGVSRDSEITEYSANLLIDILQRHADDLGWRSFPTTPPADDHLVNLKQVLDEFVTRFTMLRAADNPIRIGEVEIHTRPSPLGTTHYWVRFGDTTVPGVVAGGPKEALQAARETVRRHTTALGELL